MTLSQDEKEWMKQAIGMLETQDPRMLVGDLLRVLKVMINESN